MFYYKVKQSQNSNSTYSQKQVLEYIDKIASSPNMLRNTEARLSIYSNYQPYQINTALVEKIKKETKKPIVETIVLDNETNEDDDLTASRGANTKNLKNNYPEDLKIAIPRLMLEDISAPTPTITRGVAAIYISQGQFDAAVDKLEKEVKNNPNNALLLNDLATSYFTRGDYTEQPKDYVYALSTIDEALAINPTNPEMPILFNRALMFQKLFLERLAREAWEKYLSLETNPDWQKEARKHLDVLNAPTFEQIWEAEKTKLANAVISNDLTTANQVIEKYPHPSRMYVIDDLLPAWADFYLAEKFVEAQQPLKIAEFIGSKLVTLQQDKLVQDMVSTIISLPSNATADKKRHDLAIAHQFYGKAKYFLERSEVDNALLNLNNAVDIFSKINDIASASHIYLHIARCQANINSLEALNTIRKLLFVVKQKQYPYLLARTYMTTSHIYQIKVELSKAIEFGQKAIKILETIQDFPDTAIACFNLCSIFSSLKDQEAALKLIHKSLKQSTTSIKSFKYINSLGKQGEQVLFLGKPQIAIYFYDEAFLLAIKNKIESGVILSLLKKAQINQYLNNKKALFEDIQLIKEHTDKIPDKTLKNFTKDLVTIIEAKNYITDEPEKAIILCSKLIEQFEQTKDTYYNTQIYMIRFQAYLQVRKVDLAKADLLTLISELEKQRKAIKEQNYRISFFEEPISIYEELVKLKINHNNEIETAFDYVERSHARTLLDEIETYHKTTNISKTLLRGVSNPFTSMQIQSQLPEKMALLEYLVLKDEVFIWVIKHTGINFAKVTINQIELNKLIDDYSTAIQKDNSKEQLKVFSDRFYQLLITPIAKFISLEDSLAIVPDKELYKLPFAAFTNPNTNKYLLEENAISYAPSAAILINNLKRDLQLSKQSNKKILVIGNPTFSKESFPGLRSLSGAEKEAEQIAKIYSSHSYLLKEEKATKKEFARLSSQFNTIHFAGHSIANPKSPLYSVIVMATEHYTEENTSALYAYELYSYNFDKTQLVVLAACQTAKGQVVKGEGLLSITRPFLAKGVPSVVASLWNTNDAASETLFIEFHKQRNAGENLASALRKAQLSLLNNDNPYYHSPKIWAPFVIFGHSNTTNKF
ncbi:MAG: CHAT domain-containing protein [Acidobacteria bacterium]|nr:CHAT domain-containing protein [Acidobacteriota bacterium]